jgi:sugar O-acyltransferase (sialic acid O-acetyltransferase NeuD family)
MNPPKPPIAIVSLEWDVVDLIESIDAHRILGFFDACSECATRDFRFLGTDDDWQKILAEVPDLKIALAIDHPEARKRLFDHYGNSAIVRLISPHAHVAQRASIGHGSIVQRGVTVMPYAQVDVGCKLNVNCTVHHEARIGAFTTLAPGSQILGNVTIGEGVYVGAGAVIRQRCRIGEGAIIGAGAVVVADVPPGATVVGVPAKRRLR